MTRRVPVASGHVLRTFRNPSWLPQGSVAEVVADTSVPSPVALVRLLVTDGQRIFVTPGVGGGWDIPNQMVGDADPDEVLARLVERVCPNATMGPIGYVRTTVAPGHPGYQLPTPLAHFVVWMCGGEPIVPGAWSDEADARDRCGQRHWWLLAADAMGWARR